jgi:hypothetical protein
MKVLCMTLVRVVAAFFTIGVTTANAQSVDIAAQYRPDASTPHVNRFVITSNVPSNCAVYQVADVCDYNRGIFYAYDVNFRSSGPIAANHNDPRQGAMIKVPALWRTAQLTHSGTGESVDVQVRVAGLASYYTTVNDSVVDLVGGGVSVAAAHNMLWGSDWKEAPSPCRSTGLGSLVGDNRFVRSFWRTPVDGACAKTARYTIPTFGIDGLGVAYELRTPDPLKMKAGEYTGSLTYTAGPGQDFDMGDVLIPDDPVITMNFRFDVEHALKVDVPPGGHNIELVPQGGWQAWLNSGRRPTALLRDQTFNISTSTPFTMKLECQYNYPWPSQGCGLSDEFNNLARLTLQVSLPHGLADAAGAPIKRVLLHREFLQHAYPNFYLDRKPATLHFSINRDAVEQMLLRGSKRYSGTVTVIFDSELAYPN